MITLIVFGLTAILLPLILNEVGDWSPWLAVRLVRWTAAKLGNPLDTERYAEEWEANLEEVPGKLTRLGVAISITLYAPRLRRSLRRRRARQLDRHTVAIRPPAISLLSTAHTGLTEAREANEPAARYVAAHLAALRAAAAVVAAAPPDQSTPRGRPRSVWIVLPEADPTFRDWATFFAASASRRAAAEAGLPEAVTSRDADELLWTATRFVTIAETAVRSSYPDHHHG